MIRSLSSTGCIIGFLSVSLGSSKLQLHDSLCSRHACSCSEAGFSGQDGDRVDGCTTEDQLSVVSVSAGTLVVILSHAFRWEFSVLPCE
jgi:hypothetical protein